MKMAVISVMFRLSVAVVCIAVLWSYGRSFLRRPVCPTYGGFTHPEFEEVKRTYVQNILSGFDKGSSFAVYRNGEALVDLWGGCADEDKVKAWEKDTLSQAWSVTKGITALLMATLVDKGRLDVHRTVAHYWPEFAQNGKENITVGMLLSHQAGLSHLERRVSLHVYRDEWSQLEDLMARQAPLWEPGTKYFYHALTWGMYADAVVRKVDAKHRSVTQYFQEEIADRLNGLDFYIGLPKDQYYRSTRAQYISLWGIYAELFLAPDHWAHTPDLLKYMGLIQKTNIAFHFMDNPSVMEDADLRSIGVPSSHGFGNARSVAKLFDFLANNGTVRGERLFGEKAARLLTTSFTDDAQGIYFTQFPISPLGTMLDSVRPDILGHRGYGGQAGYADMKRGIAVGYVTNYKDTSGIKEDPRLTNVLDVFYQCYDKFNKL